MCRHRLDERDVGPQPRRRPEGKVRILLQLQRDEAFSHQPKAFCSASQAVLGFGRYAHAPPCCSRSKSAAQGELAVVIC